MPSANINVAGVWKSGRPWVKVAGVWQGAQSGWVKVAGVWRKFYQNFTPVTHLYTTGTAGAVETVPANATSVTVTVIGGGGSGGVAQARGGGGGGGRCISTFAVTGGLTMNYVISFGAAGVGSSAPGNNATSSSVSSGTQSLPATMTAGGGGGGVGGVGAAGTAVGGNISNTPGQAGSIPNGGNSGAGTGANATAPGGGSNSDPSVSGAGAAGSVQFDYT